jgi:hypothetical protein
MSTDPSDAALARDDMAIAESFTQAAAIPPRDLAELAAAVDRLEALIAAASGSEPDGSDAIERIADIAFVLHERDVEASLCDALDAAVRDLGNSDARTQANVERMRQAAELLRELSRRVNSIIARSLAVPSSAGESTAGLSTVEPAPGGEQAREENAIAEMSGGGLEQAAIATLAAPALPLADQAAAASDLPHEHAAGVAVEQTENRDIARGDVESNHEVDSRREADRQDEPHAVSPTANAEKLCAQREAAMPPDWQTLAGPEDDPGDLFEPRNSPMAAPADKGAAEAELATPEPSHIAEPHGVGETSVPPAPPTLSAASTNDEKLPPAPAPAQQVIARQAPSDPLAAMSALSEEEMIALFS